MGGAAASRLGIHRGRCLSPEKGPEKAPKQPTRGGLEIGPQWNKHQRRRRRRRITADHRLLSHISSQLGISKADHRSMDLQADRAGESCQGCGIPQEGKAAGKIHPNDHARLTARQRSDSRERGGLRAKSSSRTQVHWRTGPVPRGPPSSLKE